MIFYAKYTSVEFIEIMIAHLRSQFPNRVIRAGNGTVDVSGSDIKSFTIAFSFLDDDVEGDDVDTSGDDVDDNDNVIDNNVTDNDVNATA